MQAQRFTGVRRKVRLFLQNGFASINLKRPSAWGFPFFRVRLTFWLTAMLKRLTEKLLHTQIIYKVIRNKLSTFQIWHLGENTLLGSTVGLEVTFKTEKTVLMTIYFLIPSLGTPFSNAEIRSDTWQKQVPDKCKDFLSLC